MSTNVHKIIEKQVNFWRIQRKKRESLEADFVPANLVTVSNAYGSNGVGIAHMVAEQLDIPAYDREIVEHIATSEGVQTQTVETLDETVQTKMEDYVLSLFRERNFGEGNYLRGLTRAIMALWGHGPCVLIGRGASQIVYRKNTLAVRVVAPAGWRIRWLVDNKGVSPDEADRRLQRIDAERAAFIRQHFGQDIEDPLIYDLVINRVGMTDDAVSALIVEAYRKKMKL